MSKVNIKYLDVGTGTNQVNSTNVHANYAASNYTATDTYIKGHLQGIDNALSGISVPAGDLSEDSFSIANNQSSPANVTGFAFANGGWNY